jgi:hypothetical protein
MISIFSSLTGLPTSAFTVVVSPTNKRMETTAQVTVKDSNAGSAANLIVSTVESDPNYLSSQDPSLPRVNSASSRAVEQDNTGLIVGVVVGVVVGVALIVIIIVVIVRKRQFNSSRSKFMDNNIELGPSPAYGMI